MKTEISLNRFMNNYLYNTNKNYAQFKMVNLSKSIFYSDEYRILSFIKKDLKTI